MAGDSKIEWTDKTYNPIVGCSVVSPGCTNCYAMRTAARMAANPQTPHYHGTVQSSKAGPVWTGKVAMASDATLLAPMRWRNPCRIFVNSMSDLFHESIPDEWIDRVFAVMALCPQHTFQVLTKRAERMRGYMSDPRTVDRVLHRGWEIDGWYRPLTPWPLPNVWLGVSCERQQEADERIPHLLQTPAAIRFVSAEPLLGPIDFTRVVYTRRYGSALVDTLRGVTRTHHNEVLNRNEPRLDWIIVGGESGPNARPMHPQWARDIQKQCDDADVRFFFKQWGAWAPQFDECGNQHPSVTARTPVHVFKRTEHIGTGMVRVGKKAAGRLLDGKEHNEFPVTDSSVSQSGLSSHESKTSERLAKEKGLV